MQLPECQAWRHKAMQTSWGKRKKKKKGILVPAQRQMLLWVELEHRGCACGWRQGGNAPKAPGEVRSRGGAEKRRVQGWEARRRQQPAAGLGHPLIPAAGLRTEQFGAKTLQANPISPGGR